jgi:zinc protease
MKNFASAILVLLLVFPLCVSAKVQVESWSTENNVSVLYAQVPDLEMVDVYLAFDAGGMRDGTKTGLSNLVSALILQGASDLNVDEFNEAIGLTGGILSSGSTSDMGYIKMRSLTEDANLEAVMRLLKLALSSPRFDNSDVDRLVARTLIGLDFKKQSPAAMAQDELYAELFAEHPYGSPHEGTAESVKSITRDDVNNFFKEFYVAENLNISIVGAVNLRKAKAMAEEISSALAVGVRADKVLSPALKQMGDVSIKRSFPSIQSHIRVGVRSVARGHPDYFPLLVANHALGGNSLVSILFRSIREERGLAYSAYSYFSPRLNGGSLVAALQTDRGNQEEALSVLDGSLEKLRLEGFSVKDIDSAKDNLISGFPLRVDTNAEILNYLAMLGFYKLPIDYLETFAGNVGRVTRAEASKVFNQYFSPKKLVTVIIGPNQDGDE